MRIVFMGSSSASATCLRAILRCPELEVVGVVTQPDRPAGRGKALTPCPCKAYAESVGIADIITPENVNDDEPMAKIRAWAPDVIAVVAYGQFLKSPLLNLPMCGCVNCHFSLLPKYRGASPVVAAIASGERLTGTSVIRMGIGMDDGPILLQAYEPIFSDDTGGSLMDRLAILGGVTLAKALRLMWANRLPQPIVQNGDEATFARKLKKSDGLVDWGETALVIDRRIRAYAPWPGCFTFLPERFRRKGNSGRVIVTRSAFARLEDESWKSAAPGTVLAVTRRGPVIRCVDTALLLLELKPEGGQTMDGGAFLSGRRLVPFEDRLVQS